MEYISIRENGIVLELLVQPGSKRTQIDGLHENRLKIKIAARAVDGAANAKLCALICKLFKVSKSSITLLAGEKSRQKKVFILGDAKSMVIMLEKALSKPE
jgi:uncharacterized protein (TIGR00251 family)